jgi:FKBP-type peptidyl-prolyl cis-trans isomerase FkpA
MRIVPSFFALSVTALLGCNQQGGGGAAKPVTLTTEDDKTLYALGLNLGRNAQRFALTPAELEVVQLGVRDSVLGNKPQVELEAYGMKINDLARARQAVKATQEKEKSKAYLEKAAAEAGAQKLPSGLVYSQVTAGTGDQPAAQDTVKVHYKGTLTDGTEFDSSYKRNAPATFPLMGVIKCWTEGVALMKVGGKSRLVCPSDIAYGDMGRPPTIPGGATLVFEVELLEVVKAAAPAAAPAPAADAQKNPAK